MSPPLQSPGPRNLPRTHYETTAFILTTPPTPCRRAIAHILECPQGCLFLLWIGTVREDVGGWTLGWQLEGRCWRSQKMWECLI